MNFRFRIKAAVAAAAAALSCGLAGHANARELDVEAAPDIKIHVIDVGESNTAKPVLVFIPGWRFSGSIWTEQIIRFQAERRVIAIDPRSQGQSTITAEGDTPEQRAQDLHEVLQKLGVRRAVLIGWSQGAQDVAAYVARYGTSELAGLVLVDSAISEGAAHIATSPNVAAQQLGLLPMLAAHPREYTEGMMRAVITKDLSLTELKGLVDNALKTPSAIAAAMLVADIFGTDRSAAIAKFDRPTLIIASSTSPELTEQKVFALRIPNSEFQSVPKAGHAVFVDEPAVFDELLKSFLTRNGC